MDDPALLRQFQADRSEQAFEQLVRRHVNLVYSSALRQVKDPATAEDVTQSVFVLLATKAQTVRAAASLAGWLLVTTRYVAINALRSESRRQKHEREAAMLNEAGPAENQWDQIGPLLDEAIAKLKSADRDALALRFFQGKSAAEMAAALGVSQAAAQKRLSRAVERLRSTFAARGIQSSHEALASLLSANAVLAAPAALPARISTVALTRTAAATTTGAAAKGTVILMASAKAKLALVSIVGLALLGTAGTVVYRQLAVETKPHPVQVGDAMERLRKVYALGPNEAVKFVQPPFIPERHALYLRYATPARANLRPDDLYMMVIRQDDPSAALNVEVTRFGNEGTVRFMFQQIGRICSPEVDLPPGVLDRNLPGDWVVRPSATPQQRFDACADALGQLTGQRGRFVTKQIERDAIVVAGKFALRPITESNDRSHTVHFFRGKLDPNVSQGSGSGSVRDLLRGLSEIVNEPLVMETTVDLRSQLSWQTHSSAYGQPQLDDAAVDELLANIAKQTSLSLKRARRAVPIWTWEANGLAEWKSRFSLVYALAPGQIVKHVAAPFIPERYNFASSIGFAGPGLPDPGNTTFIIDDAGGELLMRISTTAGQGYQHAIKNGTGVWLQNVDAPADILDRPSPGDWVFKQSSTQPQRLDALAKIIGEETGEHGKFVLKQVERDAIVVAGQYAYTPLPQTKSNWQFPEIHVFQKSTGQTHGHTVVQNVAEMALHLGDFVDVPVVIESDLASTKNVVLTWHLQRPRQAHPGAMDNAALDAILSNVGRQTSLQFRRQRRVVPIWTWESATP